MASYQKRSHPGLPDDKISSLFEDEDGRIWVSSYLGLAVFEQGKFTSVPSVPAGARAYLLKDAMDVELLQTIRAVHAGRKSISPEVSFQLAEHATDDALTAGEVRVLALIAEGRANKEIAKRLSISEATVKGQVQNILSKLGAKDRTHAAMIGLKRGIIQH